jgi:hypothetical protein
MSDDQSPVEVLPVKLLPTERLIPAPWNPNKMSQRKFKRLVASVQEDGFAEPALVVPAEGILREKYLTPEQMAGGGDWWFIVGGHHRWEAARLLAMPKIPCAIKTGWTEDDIKLRNVKMNTLRGSMDPEKFTKLYMDVAERHGEEFIKSQMGLVEDAEFKRLMRDVTDGLPREAKRAVQERADAGDIHSVDDLSRILNELFDKHGDTLELSYLVFDFGGRTHFWVPMDRRVKAAMEKLAQRCYTTRVDVNSVFTQLLLNADAVDAAFATATPLDPEADFG